MRKLDAAIGALVVLALFGLAGPADAQTAEGDEPEQTGAEEEIELVYEREMFMYPATSRRDPFAPLTDDSGVGPRFEDLTLKGIIYSPSGGVALLVTGNNKYRVKQGDRIGNARVLEIRPLQVRFAVENFGVVQQEVLELTRERAEGT